MQEFLTNNTVSCNLMSLTGYRTLIILNELLKSPKTIDELNDCLENNQYIKERFSADTLRIYINTLREIGCEITKASKKTDNKFVLITHPFEYNISQNTINTINKILEINDSIDVQELLKIEKFILKLCELSKTETKEVLYKLLILNRLNKNILNDLINICQKKNQITIKYNSPNTGIKDIEIITDKLVIKKRKLYLTGSDLTHNAYATFPVERILEVKNIKLKKT